ncbi:AraC-type DNA-binding protein [Micromonospora saelicesensis]|uniref:AraC-type DNA-binding protein n=1 Tax=Micromonospora saelicesensis TaxID=285676 RepID=A0A1C4Z8P9_9ACTN|nr:AraC-type DNA-binding protein [Micromonospora saelicesensis]
MDVLDADGTRPLGCRVRAWRPRVPGISEVFHAQIVDYAYPLHAHDTWTVLILDAGAIRYDLDNRHCAVSGGDYVAVLPPGVVHDGRPAANAPGFRKRNLYLDPTFLPANLIGSAVDHTTFRDGPLRRALARLHHVLDADEDPLNAEARLAMIEQRLTDHLAAAPSTSTRPEPQAARALRALLDEHTVQAVSLAAAARLLDRSVPHLVRSFGQAFGISPHAYIIGRRIEAARKLLLAGIPPAEVAITVGFCDQAHLTRHFRRHTSTTPARYASVTGSRAASI